MESVTIPSILYHLTTKALWPSIQQHGLTPQDASGEWKQLGYKGKTFLISDKQDEDIDEVMAIMLGKHPGFDNWSDEQWEEFNAKWVILTIDASKVRDLKLEIDPASPPGVQWYMTSTWISTIAIIDVQPLHS